MPTKQLVSFISRICCRPSQSEFARTKRQTTSPRLSVDALFKINVLARNSADASGKHKFAGSRPLHSGLALVPRETCRCRGQHKKVGDHQPESYSTTRYLAVADGLVEHDGDLILATRSIRCHDGTIRSHRIRTISTVSRDCPTGLHTTKLGKRRCPDIADSNAYN